MLTNPEGHFCLAWTDVVGTAAWSVSTPSQIHPGARAQVPQVPLQLFIFLLPILGPGGAGNGVGSVVWAQLSLIITYSLQEKNRRGQNRAVVTQWHFMVTFF